MTTKVSNCEKAALDDIVLPIIHHQQRFAGMVEGCECGTRHLDGSQRVSMVRLMSQVIAARETEIRALKSQIEQMRGQGPNPSVGDVLLGD